MLRLFQSDSDPLPVDTAALTVAELVRLYLAHCAAEGTHCPEARDERERTLVQFVSAVGHLPVAECKSFHLTDWIADHVGWRSVSTRRGKASAVRAAFNWAVNGERIDRNPFARIRFGESERRPEMPDAIIDHVATTSNKPFERALRFLRLTGCRMSELCRARWADIDFERALWIVPRPKSFRFTRKPKIIALIPDAIALLHDVARASAGLFSDAPPVLANEALGTNGIVFTNSRGTAWTRRTLGQQWLRVKKRKGIVTNASVGGIRHTTATQALRNGAPLKFVSLMLGHRSTQITERHYLHVDSDYDAMRAAAILAAPK